MKHLFLLFTVLLFISCSERNEKPNQKEEGEIGVNMLRIQIHHSKLYFAGMNGNWDLAYHENHEMEETFEQLDETDDHEIEDYIKMIYPSLENLESAIESKNKEQFIKYFEKLNVTCNSCHIATNHPFIKIKNPDTAPFTNQVY